MFSDCKYCVDGCIVCEDYTALQRPSIGRDYTCAINGDPTRRHEGVCRSVNSSTQTALMDFSGIIFEVSWADIWPVDGLTVDRIDAVGPDECRKCRVQGELHKTCCICRNCGGVIWGF